MTKDLFEGRDMPNPTYEAQSAKLARRLGGQLNWKGTEAEFAASLDTFMETVKNDFPSRPMHPDQETLTHVYAAFDWLKRENAKQSNEEWRNRVEKVLDRLAQAIGGLR